jgi:tetratricopeptide (TPR) repeat protein
MKKLIILIVLVGFIGCSKKIMYQPQPDETEKQIKLKAQDYFTSGMFFQMKNEHEKALIEFYQALLYDSTSSTIYNRIAENHMALSRYESALKYLQMSLKIDNSIKETYRLMADCYYQLRRERQAITSLRKVLDIDPYDMESHYMLMQLYRKNADYLALANHYETMITIFGVDKRWLNDAIDIYKQLKKYDEAIALYNFYLSQDSTDADVWYGLGLVYDIRDDREDGIGEEPALANYLKALQLQDNHAGAAEGIIRNLRAAHSYDRLIEIFQPIYQKNQDFFVARLGLAEGYFYTKEYQKSKNLMLPLLKGTEIPWQVYDLLGRNEMEEQNPEKAKSYFREVINLDKRNRLGWLYLGFVYGDQDSLAQAEATFRKALQQRPNDPYILMFLGQTLNRLSREDEALKSFELAAKTDPENIDILVQYGNTLNRLGKKNEAVAAYEKANELNPDYILVIDLLGMLYDELKLFQKSDSIYENALQRFPENDLLMNNYAYILAVRNERLEYAFGLAQKAVMLKPENAAYLDTIGWIYYRLGKYDLALTYIKHSLEKREQSGGPDDNAVVIEHLGDVYFKLGRLDEAKENWHKALQLDDTNVHLQEKLQNVQDLK